jgi:hypothetical protein
VTLTSAKKVAVAAPAAVEGAEAPRAPRQLPTPLAMVALGMGAVAAFLVFVATSKGAGITYDSNFYLSAGLNFATGHGLVDFHNQALVWYPPGYAIEFSVAHWIGVGFQSMNRVVSCIEIATLVWLSFVLLRRHVQRHVLVLTGTILVGIASPLLVVYDRIWSETAFLPLCLAFILIMESLVKQPERRRLLVWAVLVASLAFLFRYLGLSLIPTGAIALYFGLRDRGHRAALETAARFTGLGLIVPVLWFIRNDEVAHTFAGNRGTQVHGVSYVALHFFNTIGEWIWPTQLAPSASRFWLGVLAVVVGVVVAGLFVRRLRAAEPGVLRSTWSTQLLALCAFPVCYLVAYFIGDQGASTPAGVTRLASPIFIPLLVLAYAATDRWLDLVRPKFARTALAAVVGLVGVAIVVQAASIGLDANSSARNGISYAAPTWTQNAFTLAAADLHVPSGTVVITNGGTFLYPVLQRTLLPVPTRTSQPVPSWFIKKTACSGAILMWTNLLGPGTSYLPSDLRKVMVLTELSSEPGGQIYRLSALPGSTVCASTSHR